jgi:hypothetical protein
MDITEMTNVVSRKLTSIVRALAIALGVLVILGLGSIALCLRRTYVIPT